MEANMVLGPFLRRSPGSAIMDCAASLEDAFLWPSWTLLRRLRTLSSGPVIWMSPLDCRSAKSLSASRAGNAKSCGADFYDMPELERLPNPLQERCQQGSQILGTPSPGAFVAVPCLVLGVPAALLFNLTKPSSNVGCRWPTGAGSTASCVRDDPVVSVTLASENGSPIA
jgi:hypothetical protein